MRITTLLMAALCLLLSTLSAAQKFKSYDYPDGDFSIDFPAEPKVQTNQDRVILTSVEKKTNTIYQVIYYTKKYDVSNAKDWYDNAITPYGKEEGSRKDLSNQDLQGKAAKASSNGYNFKIQVWLGRNHCWVFATAQAGKYPSEAVANAYFDSFKAKGTATVGNNSSNSSNTTASTTTYAEPEFDLMTYFRKKSFPYIDKNDPSLHLRSYNDISSFLELDLPKIKQIITKYGEAQVSQSNAGKGALAFLKNVEALSTQFPSYIDKALVAPQETTADLVKGQPRLSYLNAVANLGKHFVIITNNNDEATKKAAKKAQDFYDKSVAKAPYIKNDFHKTHLNQVVLFKNPTKAGEEKAADIVEVVAPNKGVQILGYYPRPLKDSKKTIFLKMKVNKEVICTQRLFVWEKDKEAIFDKNAVAEFNIFPNVEKLNYSSHYQFDPQLNVLNYLLQLEEGQHKIEFGFKTNYLSSSESDIGYTSFILDWSNSSKQKAQKIYDQLLQKRIETLVLPHCKDNSAAIANKDAFAKYGRLLKYVQTEEIGIYKDKKYPYPVIGKGTGGWAAIERPNGDIELIPIGLYMATGKSVWSFTSIGVMPSAYDLNHSKTIFTGRGEFGYLMKAENVAKCSDWQ